jgi:hypothetical protein
MWDSLVLFVPVGGEHSLGCREASAEAERIPPKPTTSWLGSGPRGRRFKSSRPDQFPKEIRGIQSARSLGSSCEFPSQNRVLGAPNHLSAPPLSEMSDRPRFAGSFRPILPAKCYPVTLPDTVLR